MKLLIAALIATTLLPTEAQRPQGGRGAGPRPMELGTMPQAIGEANIAWYTTWDSARAEAKRTNKPIFFFAAAAQCRNVSGVF